MRQLMRNCEAQNSGSDYVEEKRRQTGNCAKKQDKHQLALTQGSVIRETLQVHVLGDWVGGSNTYDNGKYWKKRCLGSEGVGCR